MNFNIIGTNICNYCIALMKTATTVLGISYGALNVLLFIIIQPLAIVLFAIAAILYAISAGKVKRTMRVIAHFLFSLGMLVCLFEVFLIAAAMLLN